MAKLKLEFAIFWQMDRPQSLAVGGMWSMGYVYCKLDRRLHLASRGVSQ